MYGFCRVYIIGNVLETTFKVIETIKLNDVFVSLTQLIWTIHNICKVRGSNPDHQNKN